MDLASRRELHKHEEPGKPDAAIVVRGLNHWFGAAEARKQALFDVNLAIERGKLTVLLGASGSGKTTLLTLMGCLRRVQEGSVTLLGVDSVSAVTFSSPSLPAAPTVPDWLPHHAVTGDWLLV